MKRSAQELDALAQKLRLTPMMRAFCEALASDPEGNRTRAARAVGCNNPSVRASSWLALAKVQQYMSALTEEARNDAIQRTGGAIADLSECLEFLSTVQRTRLADYLGDSGEVDLARLRNAPAGVIRTIEIKSTTDENGQVYAQHKLGMESAVAAAQTLVKHYDGQDVPRNPQTLAVIVDALPAAVCAALVKAALAGGNGHGNGNGHRTIDVEASSK